MPDDPVLTERRDGVLLVTLNRPDARNAVNTALAEGIAAALDDLDADAHLTVGVLTGAGKGFSAGMDLKAFVAGERPWVGGGGRAAAAASAAAAQRGDGDGALRRPDLGGARPRARPREPRHGPRRRRRCRARARRGDRAQRPARARCDEGD